MLRDCVRFVVSRNLESEVDAPRKDTLIFVGLDEVSLRMLVLEPRISSPAYVLLTRRNAAYLKATIKAIHAVRGADNERCQGFNAPIELQAWGGNDHCRQALADTSAM